MATAEVQKCVHKGCGKKFTNPSTPACRYHPGPPVFHEGQKGWKCCKPRVLTFDEFMEIPPCTTGEHSTVDDTPAPPATPSTPTPSIPAPPKPRPIPNIPSTAALSPLEGSSRSGTPSQDAAKGEVSDSDPEDDGDSYLKTLPPTVQCKRQSCEATPTSNPQRKKKDQCQYHSGSAIFHEGSKGWSCCKRRVLEFDDFLKMPGCKTRDRHLFAGRKRIVESPTEDEEEVLTDNQVRSDFYQTAGQIHASFFLKKIDAKTSTVSFTDTFLKLDLVTTDLTRRKRWRTELELFGKIEPKECSFRVLGTKLEVVLQKSADEGGRGWPALRKGDAVGGGIYQVAGASRM